MKPYPISESNDPNDVLCRAGEIIEEYGWTQRTYHNSIGAVCLVGAIEAAITGEPEPSYVSLKLSQLRASAYALAEKRILKRKKLEYEGRPIAYEGSISLWNDSLDRTKEEVVSLLKEDC